MGRRKNPADYGAVRKRLLNATTAEEETALKAARNYGGNLYIPNLALPTGLAHQHFGQIIISCEKADLRPDASGIAIYTDGAKSVEYLPAPGVPREEVINALYRCVVNSEPAKHSGEWARATTAVCLAMLESAKSGRDSPPACQVGYA
jgi:phthalate 4,5-cis-dihydrodiol dehydrogenase